MPKKKRKEMCEEMERREEEGKCFQRREEKDESKGTNPTEKIMRDERRIEKKCEVKVK